MEKQSKRVFNVGTRSFIAALIILFLLMALTYALTFLMPAGEYQRVITDGKESIVSGTYQSDCRSGNGCFLRSLRLVQRVPAQ